MRSMGRKSPIRRDVGPSTGCRAMSKADVAAAILWVGATFYALFGGADFGGGLLGPDRRRRREGRAAAGADPALADPGLGGQPRLADLHPRRPLDRLPAGLQRRDDDALRADRAGRGGDRPARLRLRLPQVDRGPRRRGARRARPSRSPRVLTPFFMGAVVGAIAAGNVPADGNGDAFSSWLEPLPLLTGAMFVATGAYLSAVFLVGDARRAGDADLERYFVRRALAAGGGRRRRRRRRPGRAARRSALRLRPPHRPGPAAGDPLGALRGRPAGRSCCAAVGGRCARSPPAPWSP